MILSCTERLPHVQPVLTVLASSLRVIMYAAFARFDLQQRMIELVLYSVTVIETDKTLNYGRGVS